MIRKIKRRRDVVEVEKEHFR